MAFKQKTLTTQANTGYVLVLDPTKGFSSVKMRSTVDLYVQTVAYDPVLPLATLPTPTSAFIPGAGLTTDVYKMAANEVVTFGVEAFQGGNPANLYSDTIQRILVWSTGAGDLVINAH